MPSAIPPSRDSAPTLASRLVGLTGGALVAYLAWNGLTGFISQWPQASDAGRMIQTGAQLLSGTAALACLATAPSGGRWWQRARHAFAATTMVAGGVAPVAWGGASYWVGAAAALGGLGIAYGLTWMLRRGFDRRARGSA